MVQDLTERVSQNNEWLKKVEQELFSRVGRKLKGCTTANYMSTLQKRYETEVKSRRENRKEVLSKRDTGKTIKLDTTTTNEKKV